MSISFQLPLLRDEQMGVSGIIEATAEGAIKTDLEIPPECVVSIPQDMDPTGTPHPFMVLKHRQNLISFRKRDSPIHSEVLELARPCKTFICAYTFQPRLYVGLQKPDGTKYIRCLTLREAAQIQGFPADYPFQGSHDQIITQIGNAVPGKLIEQIIRQVMN